MSPANALASPLTHDVCFLLVFTHPQLSDTVATVYWRVEEWRKRQRHGQTGDMALRQINVITALIRQPFNLKGARTHTEREREEAKGKRRRQDGEKRKRELWLHSDVCVHPTPPRHHHLFSSPPPSFHWLWWAPWLLCVRGYLKVTHLEEIPGDRRARSYRTQPKQLHLNPEGQTHRWTDLSFTLVLLLTSTAAWTEPVALG